MNVSLYLFFSSYNHLVLMQSVSRHDPVFSLLIHYDLANLLIHYLATYLQTEETKSADINGPKGIISAIGISILAGWGYILGITFAVTNIPNLLSKENDAGGYAIAQIFYEVFKNRYGNGAGGIVCLGIVAVAVFFCGMSSLTSNSRCGHILLQCQITVSNRYSKFVLSKHKTYCRMAYAFSRDGAMPFSAFWHKVNHQDVPLNAVWMSAFIAFCMALTV